MHDEPLIIPDAQQARIAVERLGGWQIIGWVQDSGWEAVINKGSEWGRILEDGTMKINGEMVQDKSKALTLEYSGMYGMGYKVEEVKTVSQTNRKNYIKRKYLNNL